MSFNTFNAFDDFGDRWTGTTWELYNLKTGSPIDLRRILADGGEFHQYQSILDDCWQNYSKELDDPYTGSAVFVRHWANMLVYYLMLGEREKARLQVLAKITNDMERKDAEKIQKESERLYNGFELMYYRKLEGLNE